MSDSTETATAARGDDDRGGSQRVSRSNPLSRFLAMLRGIPLFYRQVVAELRKVIWPTRKELLTYFSVVLVFVVFMTGIVAAFDFAFTQAVLAIFGGGSDPAA